MSYQEPAGDARIVAERLTYTLPDGRALFRDLDLAFGRERTGLIGPNGSGKTTLLRIVAGELAPTSGTVHRSGPVAVLPQDVRPPPGAPLASVLGIADRLAALERLTAGRGTVADLERVGDDWDLHARAEAVLGRFGVGHLPLDRPVAAVSGGEATRVALAGLALGRPDFLLLDEPTNHLDTVGRNAVHAFVEGWTGGLLVISHDRALLRRMDRIVELSALGVSVYGGGYDDYRAARAAEREAARRELDSARAALDRARRKAREVRERQARREARGRRSRSEGGMPKILLNARKAKAEGTGARIRAVTGREVEERRARAEIARQRVEEREAPRFGLAPGGVPAGRTILALEEVTVSFPGAARPVLDRVSLEIVGPERVAVVGPNGSGKTTLLHVAAGRRTPDSGSVRRPPEAETAWLDQTGLPLDPSLRVLEAFRRYHPAMEEQHARHALARFLFAGEAALQRVGTLSGGQRLRASLACVLGGDRPPSLLILDEPTNHLDLDALEAMEQALVDYHGALLAVSHDEDFLRGIGIGRRVSLGHAAPAP